jgi:hypothetical protein
MKKLWSKENLHVVFNIDLMEILISKKMNLLTGGRS